MKWVILFRDSANETTCTPSARQVDSKRVTNNEGWSLFDDTTRAQQRRDTLAAFEKFQTLIS